MKKDFRVDRKSADVLIIGGGTAGCGAAIWLGEHTDLRVLIAEKANIVRSGCLAAGVNALNAYISEGHTPEDYVAYARRDAEGIVREDLLLSIAECFNDVTDKLGRLGLVILKNPDGTYVTRGWRNVKINGENIKPILASAAQRQKNVSVINHVNITDLITVRDEKTGGNRIAGAFGFSVREPVVYEIRARAVLIATGGAAGLYRPNNPGFSRHKMWYPPFNTGAGYAMGIRAGAEMTTLENRFVALRCKDTIAPTGTIAQGVRAPQINALGECYESRYGTTTPNRIYGTVEENRNGRGPCALKTTGISKDAEQDLYRAYLNMAPSQTLKWIESGKGPSRSDVEIEGTEPYVVGGHTAGGFWVDTGRRTTVPGLYAAGDVAGGAPQKYVTGALAESEIAAGTIAEDLAGDAVREYPFSDSQLEGTLKRYGRYLEGEESVVTIRQCEEAMQKIMDEYAGGIRTDYRYNQAGLSRAEEEIRSLLQQSGRLHAEDLFDLLQIFEIRDRLTVCLALIAHMGARKETRWHTFGENTDFPGTDGAYLCYVNSRMREGKVEILYRPLVTEAEYSHGTDKGGGR